MIRSSLTIAIVSLSLATQVYGMDNLIPDTSEIKNKVTTLQNALKNNKKTMKNACKKIEYYDDIKSILRQAKQQQEVAVYAQKYLAAHKDYVGYEYHGNYQHFFSRQQRIAEHTVTVCTTYLNNAPTSQESVTNPTIMEQLSTQLH